MRRLADKLVGSAEQFSFEQRIFHFSLLLGAALTAIGASLDVYYRINPTIDLLFTGFWLLSYYFSRFKRYFRQVSALTFTVLVLVFLPYQWIINGGIVSAISFYPIILLAVVCVVLSGRVRMFVVSAMLGAVLFLVGLDAHKYGSLAALIQRQVTLFEPAIHLVIVMVAVAVLLIRYSNTYRKEKERREAYAKAVEQNYRQQLYYMEMLEDVIGRLKSERHDFNHHLGVIYALLEDAEGEKARAYTASLVNAAEKYRSIVSIPYSMLRAMLNYKLSAAKEHGIALRLDVGLPDGLALNEADLTVIAGNLLDNAIEACAAVEEGNRYLSLSLHYKPDYLIIQVENPVNPKAAHGGTGRTSKPDQENHGFGLRNIEYLANKHSGLMRIEPAPGVFKISLALLVESDP